VPVPNPRGMICWALGKSSPPASASSRILRTVTRRKLLRVVEIANIFSNDRAIARLDELPGFGIVFIAGPRRVLDRRADVSANLRSSARAGHLRRGSRRPGSLLAVTRGSQSTSSVVGLILGGPSPRRVPSGCSSVPGRRRGSVQTEGDSVETGPGGHDGVGIRGAAALRRYRLASGVKELSFESTSTSEGERAPRGDRGRRKEDGTTGPDVTAGQRFSARWPTDRAGGADLDLPGCRSRRPCRPRS
jgi:hypothetical protein